MKNYGHKSWLVADCYYPAKSTEAKSHDCICVLNTGDKDANIKITLFFENMPKQDTFTAVCASERTNHIRMDKIISLDNKKVPTDTPYAVLVESDNNIVVQYSRLDTSCGGMGLMTTIASPVED